VPARVPVREVLWKCVEMGDSGMQAYANENIRKITRFIKGDGAVLLDDFNLDGGNVFARAYNSPAIAGRAVDLAVLEWLGEARVSSGGFIRRSPSIDGFQGQRVKCIHANAYARGLCLEDSETPSMSRVEG